MAIDDGGPAFPEAGLSNLPNGEFIHGRAGMTLRDYLIAHAPAQPQPWFEPVMPDGFEPDWTINGRPCFGDEKQAAYTKQRYIQWPAAWADEQLKLRSKRNG